jgi:hypothetical protein
MNDPATPPMLTADLLEGLLDSLTRAGCPTRERLYPGLTDEQMDEITAPLGLTLSTEARVWWSRHNGGDNAQIAGQAAMSLESVVSDAQMSQQLQQIVEPDGVLAWDDRLILIAGNDTCFACDCSVPDGAPSPIWVWVNSDAEGLQGPTLPSFGSLIEIWTIAIDERLWEYFPDKGMLSNLDRLEPGRWPYGLP